MKKETLIDILKNEIRIATGCTDPVVVSYSVAKAVTILGTKPNKVKVTLSPNIYKNAIDVLIPILEERGLDKAASLGVFLSSFASDELNILENIDDSIIKKAKEFIKNGDVSVTFDSNAPKPVYIKTEIWSKDESSTVIIEDNYTNIVQMFKNNELVYSNTVEESYSEKQPHNIANYKLKEIIDTIIDMDYKKLEFLYDAAMVNKKAVKTALDSGKMELATTLKETGKSIGFPLNAMLLGKHYTAAASEGRMRGLKLPIMTITNSGNKGITNFLGVIAAGEILKPEKEKLVKAIAISSAITVYIKSFINEVSAICGCVFASAPGVSAATVYLLDGSYEDMVHAMNTVIGTFAGVICDGAKISCAYRLSAAVVDAIEYGFLAVKRKVYHPPLSGIISDNIEKTLSNLGRLNNAMKTSDVTVLNIIEEIVKKNPDLN